MSANTNATAITMITGYGVSIRPTMTGELEAYDALSSYEMKDEWRMEQRGADCFIFTPEQREKGKKRVTSTTRYGDAASLQRELFRRFPEGFDTSCDVSYFDQNDREFVRSMRIEYTLHPLSGAMLPPVTRETFSIAGRVFDVAPRFVTTDDGETLTPCDVMSREFFFQPQSIGVYVAALFASEGNLLTCVLSRGKPYAPTASDVVYFQFPAGLSVPVAVELCLHLQMKVHHEDRIRAIAP